MQFKPQRLSFTVRFLLLGVVLLIAGCSGGGGGDDSITNTGVFLDSAVEGLSYKTLSQEGLTDSDGSFKYLNGEDIEFYVGNIKFGKTKAQKIITPVNLTSAGSLSDPKVVNILQILQTADEDLNPDNGIKIVQSNTPLMGVGSLDLSVDEINPEELLKDAGFLEESIVSAQDAVSHFQSTVKESTEYLKDEIDNFRATIQAIDANRTPINDSELKTISNKYYNQAYLSKRIYEDSYNDRYLEKDGWVLVDLIYQDNGFKAGMYQEAGNDNYIIVYGGTSASIEDFSESSKNIDIALDILTDIRLFSNMPINPNQAKTALEFLERSIVVTAITNNQVSYITGHSLGGGLAQYAGLYTGIDTVTFNTAPLPFNNDSIEPFLNKYNYDTDQFALQIAGKNSDGDVTEFEFTNKSKIVNIMAQKDPVSFLSLIVVGLEEAANEYKNLNIFVLSPIKLSMLIANQLKLDFLITGEKIYLPIDTGNALGDHSIATICNLFSVRLDDISPSTDGLVAYFPFDGNANDASGNGNNGVENGGLSYVSAIDGPGLKLNGVNSVGGTLNPDFIRIPNSTTLQFESELTIAYFVKIDGDMAQTSADCSGDAIAGIRGTLLAKRGDRTGLYITETEYATSFGISPSQGGVGLGKGELTSVYNNFRHVSYVINGDNIKIFVDGKLVIENTGTIDFSYSNNEDLYIGVQKNDPYACFTYWYPLDGVVDELYIYNRALSEVEIQDIYNYH